MYITEYFERVYAAARNEEAASDEIATHFYTIGGLTLQLRSPEPSLVSSLIPALAHLRATRTHAPDLTAHIFQGNPARFSLPAPDTFFIGASVKHDPDTINPALYFSDEHTKGLVRQNTGTLSMLNSPKGRAVHWLSDRSEIPIFERDRPLREILKWWFSAHGFLVLHAACVGHSDGGALLVGASGTGKSSTALACLQSDLQFLGDEYVLVAPDPSPTAYCLYSSGRVAIEDAQWFPHLTPFLARARIVDAGKALLFFNAHIPDRIAHQCPLSAIIALTITGQAETRLREASAAKILAACAPSTIFQQPGSGQRDFAGIANLARQVPCYVLEAGTRRDHIPEAILELLRG